MEFDKILDSVKKVVVMAATPLGIEIAGNLAHRGLETHLVDEGAWLMSEVADPDIMEPVQKSLEELGTVIHFGVKVLEFRGAGGKLKSVVTTGGEIECDVAVIATHKKPNNA
jgi:NADH oxidase (H2O2-forming)